MPGEIGDRSRDTDDSMTGARRQSEPPRSALEQAVLANTERRGALKRRDLKPCIERAALPLSLACRRNPCGYSATPLRRLRRRRQYLVRKPRPFHVHVDAIEQGTREFREIAPDQRWCAAAAAGRGTG